MNISGEEINCNGKRKLARTIGKSVQDEEWVTKYNFLKAEYAALYKDYQDLLKNYKKLEEAMFSEEEEDYDGSEDLL